MIDFKDDKDGVNVLWDYEEGWLVYEYTGFLQKMYPAKRAWIGHRCQTEDMHVGWKRGCARVGFVSAQLQGKNICGWCDKDIPDEVHGVMALYNYGKEGERHD